jgi:soluble lytic murein transglycosylase-like protein
LFEALFFIALAILGFSVVSSLIAGRSEESSPALSQLVPASPLGSAGAVQAAGLYEAVSKRPQAMPSLSPIFTPSVRYWEDHLLVWATEHQLDPNLAATVMQIESCGNPSAQSGVGAMGLFQVMPFHFTAGEQPFDPDTNAMRGLDYLAQGLEVSGGHAGLALAGYNGGHSIIAGGYDGWHYETQRYYRWGSGIYREASAGWDTSPTLAAWLSAGGKSLCDQAEQYLGITSESSTSTH